MLSRLNRTLLISLYFIAGCSSAATPPRAEVVGYETIPGQALKEVQATPTKFQVTIADDTVFWERARLFFIQYLSTPNLSKVERSAGKNRVLLSNDGDKSTYAYNILREGPNFKGYEYTVTCAPQNNNGKNDDAQRNAKNLSRFIREGTLEISLLAK